MVSVLQKWCYVSLYDVKMVLVTPLMWVWFTFITQLPKSTVSSFRAKKKRKKNVQFVK